MTDDEGWAVPQVRVHTRAAGQLADLISVQTDFEFVLECCEELQQRDSVEPGEDGCVDVIVTALWHALAVGYRRSFTTGRSFGPPGASRLRLPDEWIDELDGRELHTWLLALADKHIAHRVSDAEQSHIQVLLNPIEPASVIGILPVNLRLVQPDRPPAEVAAFVGRLLRAVDAEVERGTLIVREQVEQVDVAELYEIARSHPDGTLQVGGHAVTRWSRTGHNEPGRNRTVNRRGSA